MSETMALESLAKSWLELDGYWTETRVPFQTKTNSGANSDLDVLAVQRNSKGNPRVVVVEVKAHGRPEAYSNYSNPGRRRQLERLLKKAKIRLKQFLKSKTNRVSYGIKRVDEFRVIVPGHLNDHGRDSTERLWLEDQLREDYDFPCRIRLICVHEMIDELKRLVTKDMLVRRKRYPDTALEMIRWIIRSGGDICWDKPKIRSSSIS